jgi:DNA (cytosine-5)-methyltransferase 1
VPTALAPIGWTEELTATVDVMGTIQRGGAGGRHDGVMTPTMAVRRLTPRECERLQSFPDDYTLIPYPLKHVDPNKLDRDYIKYLARGGVLSFEQCCNAAADGPRYKALGNSMCVFNMRWLGRRIDAAIRLQVT